mgnify:CR=1 FL=1
MTYPQRRIVSMIPLLYFMMILSSEAGKYLSIKLLMDLVVLLPMKLRILNTISIKPVKIIVLLTRLKIMAIRTKLKVIFFFSKIMPSYNKIRVMKFE